MKVWLLRISYNSFTVIQVKHYSINQYVILHLFILEKKMQINLFRVLLLELQRCLQSMICFCFQNISSINFNRFGSKNIMSYTTEKIKFGKTSYTFFLFVLFPVKEIHKKWYTHLVISHGTHLLVQTNSFLVLERSCHKLQQIV